MRKLMLILMLMPMLGGNGMLVTYKTVVFLVISGIVLSMLATPLFRVGLYCDLYILIAATLKTAKLQHFTSR
jgi:hypothetical protein